MTGDWQEIQIAGRPADILIPAGAATDRAIIFLHGYGEESLRQSSVFTHWLTELRLAAVCPSGGKQWWTERPVAGFAPRVSPQEFVAQEVTAWISREWNISPPQIALLGISMGGQGVLQLAYRQPARFPVAAAISPAIDFQLTYGKGFGIEELYPSADAARQQTVTLNLHPLNWPRFQYFCCDPADVTWFDGCQRLASKLMSSGVPFTSDLHTTRGGHGWEYFDAQAEPVLKWISARLEEVVAGK